MMSIWKKIIPHNMEDSVILTGVKQKQHHEAEAKSAFANLRLVPPVTK